MPTDPTKYILPQMDLPEFWQYAIEDRGRLYYYHKKIKISQWEPPIKLLPLMADDEKFTADVSIKIELDPVSDEFSDSENESICSTSSQADVEDDLIAELEQVKLAKKIRLGMF